MHEIEGDVVIEVQNDNTVDSDDPAAEFNNLNSTAELDLNTFLADPLFLNTHFALEQTGDPDSDTFCFFCKHGAFVEALSVNWEEDRWSAIAGKFGPNFGIAWDAAPGLYGTDTAEDYELAERVSPAKGIRLPGERIIAWIDTFQSIRLPRHLGRTPRFPRPGGTQPATVVVANRQR